MVKIEKKGIKIEYEGAEIKIPVMRIKGENEHKVNRFQAKFQNFLAECEGEEKPFTIEEEAE